MAHIVIVSDFDPSTEGGKVAAATKVLAVRLGGRAIVRLPHVEDVERVIHYAQHRNCVSTNMSDVQFLMPDQSFDPGAQVIYLTQRTPEQAALLAPQGAHVLFLHGATTNEEFFKNLRGICVPFGTRAASLTVAHVVYPLAKLLGVSVACVHTTYKKPGVDSPDPHMHMTPAAVEMEVKLQSMSRDYGVTTDFVRETADNVHDFVCRAATRARCGLIAMGRGNVLIGSCADQVERRAHQPVMIVNGGAQ